MNQNKHSPAYITLAVIMSISFSALLGAGIMARTNGGEVTIGQFLSNLENLIFCVLMFCLVLATWLMNGINNRAIIFCWCIGLVGNHSVYWLCEQYFLFENRNVYALSFLNTASALPLVLLCKYRFTFSTFVLKPLNDAFFVKGVFSRYLGQLKSTDFEINILRVISISLYVEFLYSLYLFSYAFIHDVPYDGSIYQTILDNGAWDPYLLYSNSVHLVTFLFLIILGYHTYRDNVRPDEFLNDVSDVKKRQVISEMLEERRNKK